MGINFLQMGELLDENTIYHSEEYGNISIFVQETLWDKNCKR